MTLSESLLELAGRVRKIEDSAAAVKARNEAALRDCRHELKAAIEREIGEVEAVGAK